MAATFTKLASAPDMLRYAVYDAQGASGFKTATQLIADCQAGPLKTLLTKLNAAGPWGALGDPVVSPNPAVSPKISVHLASWTGLFSDAPCGGYTFYYNSTNNILEISGGFGGLIYMSPTRATSVIVELRFNHSTVR